MDTATEQKRTHYAKLNIYMTLLNQIVAVICGFVAPRFLLNAYGSEINGAASSILQFISFISLFEGGIGGVTRAALYKPISEHDTAKTSCILGETQRLFRTIALLSVGYIGVLAVFFKQISHFTALDWASSALLVVVVSFSTFFQYFFGMTNSLYLQSLQKTYVVSLITSLSLLLNTAVIIIAIYAGADFISVKFFSSLVFILKPILLYYIVRKKEKIRPRFDKTQKYLTQKWTGLGQHLAYFVHLNTDVVLLTVFVDLSVVSVYTVYHMIISQIQGITMSFVSGMEALFGNLMANGEREELQKTLNRYESLMSLVANFLFICVAVLIVPFVMVYTKQLTDADYYQPLFGVLLCVSAWLYCLRIPYHSLTIAAGHFRQTRMAAYGEAVINIAVSVALILLKFGLVGVAVGTLLGTLFRFVYYLFYLKHHIMLMPLRATGKRLLCNFLLFVSITFIGSRCLLKVGISGFGSWTLYAFICSILVGGIVFLVNFLFYRNDTIGAMRLLFRSKR